MGKHKRLSEFQEQLAQFELDILDTITCELARIDRAVSMDEFHITTFNDTVIDYLTSIKLDKKGDPVVETTFRDVEEKHLSSFISDCEIDHWDLIGLLELLMKID